MKNKIKRNYVTILFIILSILGVYKAGVGLNFILGELYIRFIRNAFFVLALIIPISCGMGINFAITIGAILAQLSMIIAIDLNLSPKFGFIFTIILSSFLSVIFGYIIGKILNKAKGKEMIVSILIGFLGTSLFQLIFMVGYGTIIQPLNKNILLDRGIGVRSMLDANQFKDLFSKVLPIKIGDVYSSLLPFIFIIIFGILISLFDKTKLGIHTKAVGENIKLASQAGINVNKTRIISIIISTILASYSQILSIQNLGIISVYTGHLSLDTFAAASLLAGGATFDKASVKNAFLGLILFHTLFIVSPLAGQNIFKNPVLGEYFRSFIAYGTIIIALILNLKSNEKSEGSI